MDDSFMKNFTDVLMKGEVDKPLAIRIVDKAQEIISSRSCIPMDAIFYALQDTMDTIKPAYSPVKERTNKIMFVGLSGSGITSACLKYAKHNLKMGFKPAVVCTNSMEEYMCDMLLKQADKEGFIIHGSCLKSDPAKNAVESLQLLENDHDMIIFDTNGRNPRNSSDSLEMQKICQAVKPDLVILVLDARIGGYIAPGISKAFMQSVPIGALIMTKLDTVAKGGGIFTAAVAIERPIIFMGMGERLEGFRVFSVRHLATRFIGETPIFGTGDVQHPCFGLTLRKVYKWFDQATDDQHVSGFPKFIKDMMLQGYWFRKMIVSLHMMNSMTDEEIDSTDPEFFPESRDSRVNRIARGSGRQPSEVLDLLADYKVWAEICAGKRC